ncbi:substrate-binding domain-containing protein [Psychromonas sp. 14N.309.X.WAT.B.A12]|uniref:substrate-binding domain-containing protein n=1 Tax=Psychromonas sp. 14N.309.X.WAT.B.A12 TaxID=2998322 RepID=UPI0025AFB6A6|nr:substrate-binding domain-containing protein [Psychromonas sp. 14N.309.X.WAT.B.A12]MDN2664853.1 substrate-binding domain-containing protein [Psychromonas sp. 14N.309.X.WAT.B.A12]
MKNPIKYMSLIAAATLSTYSYADATSAQQYVDMAKQVVAEASGETNVAFSLPAGPKAVQDKTVIFVASDLKNSGVAGVVKGFEEAAKAIGWNVRVLDGAGSVPSQSSAMKQALALQPDGIVVGGFTPNTMVPTLRKANKLGIKLVSWHATPNPGPIEDLFIETNITSSADDVARVSAMYAIAKSEGKANVVILTDGLYSIAVHKADVMKSYIEKCEGCSVLGYEDTPLANTSARIPQLTYSLVQKHGDKYNYTLAINDLYFDYMSPALRSAGKKKGDAPYNISAGDGSESAFERIRNGDFQVATVAEPLSLHGWQVIDEFNRLFQDQPISGYVTPVHLVTAENIHSNGGDQNLYDPENNYREYYSASWNGK